MAASQRSIHSIPPFALLLSLLLAPALLAAPALSAGAEYSLRGTGLRLPASTATARRLSRLLAGKQAAPSPLALSCENVTIQISQDTTQRQITCVAKLKGYAAAPLGLCLQLYCYNIAPLGNCVTSQGGQDTQRTTTPDCSWNINDGCTSPAPVYPGSQWSFGFLTSAPGPIIIRLGSTARSQNGTCPRSGGK